ncbi:MAG: hypothetical protein ACRC3H_07805 [Lachnospiraceae bacterium]
MDIFYLIIKVLVIVVMMFLTGNIFSNKESRGLFALAGYLLMGVGVVVAVIELANRFGVLNVSYTFNAIDILSVFSVIYIVLYVAEKIRKKNTVK